MIEHVQTMQVLLLTTPQGEQSRVVIFRDGKGIPVNIHFYPNAGSPLGDPRSFVAIEPHQLRNWIGSLDILLRYLAGYEEVTRDDSKTGRYPDGVQQRFEQRTNPPVENRPSQHRTVKDLPLGLEDSMLGDAEPESDEGLHSGGDPLSI